MFRVRRKSGEYSEYQNIIYAICDPSTQKPVYIGKSTVGVFRPTQHLAGKSHNVSVNQWVSSLKKQGAVPFIVILEYVISEYLLDDKEAYWINKYTKEGYCLLNKNLYNQGDDTVDEIYSENTLKYIGKTIREYRLSMRLKQDDLSQMASCARSSLSLIEKGGNTSVRMLLKILDSLKLRLVIIPNSLSNEPRD